ncbi:MAG: dephospho-CoA kinase [Promethearchaeota archaeon]|nr:MAG: dephospho-CoA kinase [Candidatus Lokiarchaeota archaeon]
MAKSKKKKRKSAEKKAKRAITLSGLHGSGKSAVGKALAEEIGFKYYSTGQAFRDLANEKNMSLEEFTQYVENHPEIDRELDKKIVEIAKKGDIIIDSQLSGHLLQNIENFKIMLKCPLETRVKRMADRDHTSYEEKLKETMVREKSEQERFKILYDIDLEDNTIYDLIIETENLSIEEVLNKILQEIKN